MKRVLVAAALGGLLLVGTPTLASSAQRNDTKVEKGDKKDDKADRGGKKDDRGDHRHRADRRDRHRDRDHRHYRDRHGYYRDSYWYGGYGEPQECWYGPSGAYNCEPYGGDYYPGYSGGYHPGYSGGYYGHGYRNRTVVVQQHRFNPPEVFTHRGQEVLWIFRDHEPHTVTADNKSFDSGPVNQGEFRLIFEQPGTYSYHCTIHPEMKGRVVVQG